MGVETKYYIDSQGNYIGGFSEGNPAIPISSIEVSSPPADARQKYVDGAWAAFTAKVETITTRQFLIAAALSGLITEDDALSAATSGAIPPAIAAVFQTLPAADAFKARMTWAKMTIVERQSPLVAAAATAIGMNGDDIDSFFAQASNI